MDSVMSGLVAGALQGYFEVFFKNFKKEDFQLNLSGSETSTTLNNLEIREEVVQEALGVPNFGVKRVFIDKLALKLKPMQLKSSPMRIEIETIEVVLAEPWDTLPELPKVIERFLQEKLPNKGQPGQYGFVEQLVDGIRVDVRQIRFSVDTVGKYKVEKKGDWTPPPALALVKGIAVYTTNSRWEVVDLKKAREYNENRPQIYVFKELTVASINASVKDGDSLVPIIVNTKAVARVILVKQLDNQIKGVSVNAEIPELNINMKMEHIGSLAAMSEGIVACMSRPDTPKPRPVECPHTTVIANIAIPKVNITLVEKEGGDGIQFTAQDVEVGIAWPQNYPINERTISFYVGKVFLRELSAVNGPSAHPLLEACPDDPGKDPFKVIPPLPATLHPDQSALAREPALFFMKGLVRTPPEPPKFDQELQAILNPVQLVVRPESVVNLLKLAQTILPHAKAIAERRSVKPPGDLSGVMVCDPKEPYEQLMSLKMEFSRISLIIPAPVGEAYNDLSLNLLDGKVMSHPSIPKGICGSTEFPSRPGDVSERREEIEASAAQLTKYKITSKVEMTMRPSPDSTPQAMLTVPKVAVDLTVAIGKDDAGKGSILVNEGTMSIKQVGGRLTNVQYKTMVKRFDELIPLIPMAITLSESTKGVEVPKANLLFFVKIDQGELSLCNDYSGCEEKGENGEDVEMLAQLQFNSLQMCFENMNDTKVAKVALDNLQIIATGNPASDSKLYNPNYFISCANPEVPVMLLRMEHRPLQPLKTADGRAVPFDLENRSLLALRVNGFRCGANPNPAAKITYFFLDTERNLSDLLRTVNKTKQALQDVDFKKVGELAKNRLQNMEFSAKDIDIDVDVRDIKIHLLRDFTDDAPRGNVALELQRLLIDKKADSPQTGHMHLDVEEFALACNKEENGQVVLAHTFDPLTFRLKASRNIGSDDGKWEITSAGSMNQLNIDVNPRHSGVFMSVFEGVKKKNIQKIIDGLGKFMQRSEGDNMEFSLSLGEGGGGGGGDGSELNAELEKLSGWIARAEEDIVAARTEKQRATEALKRLEQVSGKSAGLATAARTGNLSVLLPNQTWGKRFFALIDSELHQYEDQSGAKLVGKITVSKDTKLEVVNNVPNCFQITGEQRFIIAAGNEKNMSAWTGELLRVQAGKPAVAGLERAHGGIARAKQVCEGLASAAKDLGDRRAMMARIRELEQQVAERDEKIKALSK